MFCVLGPHAAHLVEVDKALDPLHAPVYTIDLLGRLRRLNGDQTWFADGQE